MFVLHTIKTISVLGFTVSKKPKSHGFAKAKPTGAFVLANAKSPNQIRDSANNLNAKQKEYFNQLYTQRQNRTKLPVYTAYSKMDEVKLVTIGLASANRIRQWAEKTLPNGKVVGEVTNANTLHHKTFKPLKGGLFCERIFGPLKDFQCACGSKKTKQFLDLYQTKQNATTNSLAILQQTQLPSINAEQTNTIDGFGLQSKPKPTWDTINSNNTNLGSSIKNYKRYFCSKCDVEYTWSVIRRYQLGYIKLNAPVTHVWYVKSNPSYISLLLDMKKKDLEYVTYCTETLTLENSLKFSATTDEFAISTDSPKELYEIWQNLVSQTTSGQDSLQNLKQKSNKALPGLNTKESNKNKQKNMYYFSNTKGGTELRKKTVKPSQILNGLTILLGLLGRSPSRFCFRALKTVTSSPKSARFGFSKTEVLDQQNIKPNQSVATQFKELIDYYQNFFKTTGLKNSGANSQFCFSKSVTVGFQGWKPCFTNKQKLNRTFCKTKSMLDLGITLNPINIKTVNQKLPKAKKINNFNTIYTLVALKNKNRCKAEVSVLLKQNLGFALAKPKNQVSKPGSLQLALKPGFNTVKSQEIFMQQDFWKKVYTQAYATAGTETTLRFNKILQKVSALALDKIIPVGFAKAKPLGWFANKQSKSGSTNLSSGFKAPGLETNIVNPAAQVLTTLVTYLLTSLTKLKTLKQKHWLTKDLAFTLKGLNTDATELSNILEDKISQSIEPTLKAHSKGLKASFKQKPPVLVKNQYKICNSVDSKQKAKKLLNLLGLEIERFAGNAKGLRFCFSKTELVSFILTNNKNSSGQQTEATVHQATNRVQNQAKAFKSVKTFSKYFVSKQSLNSLVKSIYLQKRLNWNGIYSFSKNVTSLKPEFDGIQNVKPGTVGFAKAKPLTLKQALKVFKYRKKIKPQVQSASSNKVECSVLLKQNRYTLKPMALDCSMLRVKSQLPLFKLSIKTYTLDLVKVLFINRLVSFLKKLSLLNANKTDLFLYKTKAFKANDFALAKPKVKPARPTDLTQTAKLDFQRCLSKTDYLNLISSFNKPWGFTQHFNQDLNLNNSKSQKSKNALNYYLQSQFNNQKFFSATRAFEALNFFKTNGFAKAKPKTLKQNLLTVFKGFKNLSPQSASKQTGIIKAEANANNNTGYFKNSVLLKQNRYYTKTVIVNNLYCLSHREMWAQEKDWYFFAFYFFNAPELDDISVPIYEYRNYDFSLVNSLFSKEDNQPDFINQALPDFKDSNSNPSDFVKQNPIKSRLTRLLEKQEKPNLHISYSGAGIIQTLLAEFDYFELKKMDKQNRILLYDLNRYIKKLKKSLAIGLLGNTPDGSGLFTLLSTNDVNLANNLKKATDKSNTVKSSIGFALAKPLVNPIFNKKYSVIKKEFKELCKQRDFLIRRTKLIRKIFRNYLGFSRSTAMEYLLNAGSNSTFGFAKAKPNSTQVTQQGLRTSVNNLTSMVLTVLPVLPPDLRPIVKMGSQIAASDLNRLYQRVIYRNDRLKKFLNDTATNGSYEMKYAQRLLQEAVDNLIQNGKSGVVPEKDARGRALKSLSELLKGKQGRFRQYLLGKRVDYSGRSVIVVGPKLKLHECGIPKEMALELYLPFLIKRILTQNLSRTVIGAKALIKNNKPLAWSLLREIMKTCPVLLNRAPTLHRLGFQAFQPKLVDGRAILLHPLVCPAFNADFDGDQMAVHVPISPEARTEAWKLMLARNNLLSPATGEPLVLPSQDMVLGCYYLTTNSNTRTQKYEKGYGMYFDSFNDVLRAYADGIVATHSIVWVKWTGSYETYNGGQPHSEQPLEIRISSYGSSYVIYSKAHITLTSNIIGFEGCYSQELKQSVLLKQNLAQSASPSSPSKTKLQATVNQIQFSLQNPGIKPSFKASSLETNVVNPAAQNTNYSQNTTVVNRIIRTTPGKIIFNALIQKAWKGV
jgi:DNA-directed RNA polymerase subunit beta'